MKVGLNLRCFRQQFADGMTMEAALDQCVSWGADHVVIPWGTPGKVPPGIPSQDPNDLGALVHQIRQRGLEVAGFWICNDFAFVGPGDWREQQITATQHLLRLSGDLRIPNLQVWTGRYSKTSDPRHQDHLVREGLAACLPVARAANVRLSLENHTDVFPQAAELVALCQEHGPSLSLCPNPALWGIRANKELFFAADDGIHALVREQFDRAGPHTSMVNLGIWNGSGPDPAPWCMHWPALKTLLRKHLGTTGYCCFQTYDESDLLAALPGAIAAAADAKV